MSFVIVLSPDAREDLAYFTAFEQRIIIAAIKQYLIIDARIETRRRKQLQNSPVAPWELKREPYRIFYDIVGSQVDILAIGYKEHNELFIRGRRVEL
jgi:mRNA-degrading endonuclease RelE of RelBE toxin-antitoxin system